jgi:hypothetical protein
MIAYEMPDGTRSRNGKPEEGMTELWMATRPGSCRGWGRGRRGVRFAVGIGLAVLLSVGMGQAQDTGGQAQDTGGQAQDTGGQAGGEVRGGMYARQVYLPAGNLPREACVALDAQVMEHAAAGLEDVVLTADGRPQHFALTLSSAQGGKAEAAEIEEFESAGGGGGKPGEMGPGGTSPGGTSPGETSFDLKMPVKTYDSVTLDLRAKDFVTVAEVTASDGPRCQCERDAAAKKLGEFVIFDLSGQGAPRQTMLRLGETHAAYLHIKLRKQFSRAELAGAAVAPSRAAEVLFTKVAETKTVTQEPGKTVATLDVPAGIPLERVEIQVAALAPAFRRAVTVEAVPAAGKRDSAYIESFDGFIQRIDEVRDGQSLEVNQTTLDSVLVTNENGPARISVTIENGTAAPLPIESVALEMRRRSVCFEARPDARWELYYGGSRADAGGEVGKRTLIEAKNSLTATLGDEQRMSGPVSVKAVTWAEKYPALRWIVGAVLLGCLLALVLRGMRRMSGHSR